METTNLWIRGPIGRGSAGRDTVAGCRTVLVVVPTMAAGTRLFDLVPLIEADLRIQVVFTVPHTGDTWAGLDRYVHAQGGLVLPWHQAIRHDWDLVLAASHRHLAELSGPILLVPHGAGAGMSRRYSRKAGGATMPTTGLDRELLTHRGRVLPSVLALMTDAELPTLRRLCPEAEPHALVTGDICLDRMRASLRSRPRYRDALGVNPHEPLVVVSSTWSRDSVFGRIPELGGELLDEVRALGGKVALVLHPQVSTVHSPRQVRAWLSRQLDAGLVLIPPQEGWRAAVIAADWVIGDHGSTTAYAAAVGTPVSLAAWPDAELHAGSPGAVLRELAPELLRNQPLVPQVRDATDRIVALERMMTPTISSRPETAAVTLRTAMYRLMGIPEPAWEARIEPVPSPAVTVPGRQEAQRW